MKPAPDDVAALILAGFDDYRRAFQRVTALARGLFETADWQRSQTASAERIRLYKDFAATTLARLDEMFDGDRPGSTDWAMIKLAYQDLIRGREDADLAETGYNTIFRKSSRSQTLADDRVFVHPVVAPNRLVHEPLTVHFAGDNLPALLAEVLDAFAFATPYRQRERDIERMADAMTSSIPLLRHGVTVNLEMVRRVFYRNKGAYLIGRMTLDGHQFPLAIPLQHAEGEGIYVDTVIWNENDLSMIFSFTRSYFMVEVSCPVDLVEFLQDLLPAKKRWELYTALGFFKHGKTEFYRGFLDYLDNSDDAFEIAQGIKGMVMAVFTLPGYQVAFKIIKDRFSPTKTVTREQVKAAYNLVKTHDRVGRMADTQEFSNFTFPRARFTPELLAYLQDVAASSVTVTADEVIISHLYCERMMTPLNIYVEQCSPHRLRQVLDDYGNAIKQLAAANIFPGDMLPKNFGVTRHGRVVFYDYDEICYLTEVNFREIPPNRYPGEEMAAEPWFDVGPNDVFPEEFSTFLFNTSTYKDIFLENHADLFTAAYWQDIQRDIASQRVLDVYPYRNNRRFNRS